MPPAQHDAADDGSEAHAAAMPAEASDGTTENAGSPSDARGEESGQRRRRGGRGRDRGPREGFPEGESNGAAAEAMPADERASESAVTPFTRAEREPEDVAPVAVSQSASAPVEAGAQHRAEPQDYRPAPAPAVPPAPAPIAALAPAEENFVLPISSLQAVAEGAGLQWVSSDASKIRAVQEAMAATPAPLHVPREIRKVEAVDEGPLVLVETKKDLSQVRLPFETQAPGA